MSKDDKIKFTSPHMRIGYEIPKQLGDSISDSGHLVHPEVSDWLKSAAPGFKPTRQQEKFRKLAYKMARRKKFFRGEWFRATGEKSYTGVKINERIWARWANESEFFKVWFFDEFPSVEGISDEEFAMMDQQFWVGLRDGMDADEEWAFRQYAKTRFDGPGAKKAGQETEDLSELREYFKSSDGGAWSAKPGEA